MCAFLRTVIFSLLLFFGYTLPAFAIETGLNETANRAGLKSKNTLSLPQIVGNVLGAALALIGVIFLVLVVYGGFIWMTAGGDTDKVGKAKQMITNGVIGLVIVMGGYIITNFVLKAVLESVGIK